jgi:hypothetical protein
MDDRNLADKTRPFGSVELARFVCVTALASPSQKENSFKGIRKSLRPVVQEENEGSCSSTVLLVKNLLDYESLRKLKKILNHTFRVVNFHTFKIMSAEAVYTMQLLVKKMNGETVEIAVEDPNTMTVGKLWELSGETSSDQHYVLLDTSSFKKLLNHSCSLAIYGINGPTKLEVIPIPRSACSKGGKCSVQSQ